MTQFYWALQKTFRRHIMHLVQHILSFYHILYEGKVPKSIIDWAHPNSSQCKDLNDGTKFWESFLDSGALRSVIGAAQEKAYRELTSHHSHRHNSATIFWFGTKPSTSKKHLIRLPLPDGQVIHFYADIIDGNIPLLLGLDIMRKYGLVTNFCKNILKRNDYNWYLRMYCINGQGFAPLTLTIFFTRPEQTRLHLHFFHPTAEKLFHLLQQKDSMKETTE